MTTSGLLATLMIFALALAGCAAPLTPAQASGPTAPEDSTSQANPKTAAVSTTSDAPIATAVTAEELASASPAVHNISIRVDFTAPGVHGKGGGIDLPSCGPADPTGCRVGVHERIELLDRSVLNADITDTGWLVPDSVHAQTVAGVWEFTGEIQGCTGSGSMTLPWAGALGDPAITPNTSGDIIHEHDYLSAPTHVTGFAGILDAWLDANAYLNPVGAGGHGTLTGYIVCL